MPPTNAKKSTIKKLTNAYKYEKDADVLKRIMLVAHVERDGMTRTGPQNPLHGKVLERQAARAIQIKLFGK